MSNKPPQPQAPAADLDDKQIIARQNLELIELRAEVAYLKTRCLDPGKACAARKSASRDWVEATVPVGGLAQGVGLGAQHVLLPGQAGRPLTSMPNSKAESGLSTRITGALWLPAHHRDLAPGRPVRESQDGAEADAGARAEILGTPEEISLVSRRPCPNGTESVGAPVRGRQAEPEMGNRCDRVQRSRPKTLSVTGDGSVQR